MVFALLPFVKLAKEKFDRKSPNQYHPRAIIFTSIAKVGKTWISTSAIFYMAKICLSFKCFLDVLGVGRKLNLPNGV